MRFSGFMRISYPLALGSLRGGDHRRLISRANFILLIILLLGGAFAGDYAFGQVPGCQPIPNLYTESDPVRTLHRNLDGQLWRPMDRKLERPSLGTWNTERHWDCGCC